MKLSWKSIRRWSGALSLVGALLMLLAGQTWLEGRLKNAAFLGYWLICFGLTFIAMFTALLDVLLVRREGRAHQRALVESTVQEVLAARKTGPGQNQRPPG